jgi:Na+/proline symporter
MSGIIIFTIFCILLIIIGLIAAKKTSKEDNDYYLANRSLGWFIVGISAAVTGNTGFIVTGAVGIGYKLGMSSLLLPLSWLLGDLIYWSVFPKKLNSISHRQNSSTITEFLSLDLKDNKLLKIVATLIIGAIILFYTAAQWVAAGKIFSTFFDSSIFIGISLSALLVVIYSSVGGLKSSLWTDIVQAIFVTILLFTIFITISPNYSNILDELKNIDGHLDLTYHYTLYPLVGFVLGWVFASVGFGLSQPQLLIRYFAAKNAKQVKKAKWVYIIFLQITWIGFTFFGVLLRGIIPNIIAEDREQGLAIFITENYSPIFVGILIAGMFATISSTADSFLISTSNSIKKDVLSEKISYKVNAVLITFLVGLVSVIMAIYLSDSSVLKIAMTAVTYLGACIAPAMIIKLLNFKHSSNSLVLAIISGLLSALIWQYYFNFSKYVGNSFIETLNIAFVGICSSLVIHFIYTKLVIK